jgi:hypothetical protein
MPVDFSSLSSEEMFGKRREVFKMKPDKLDPKIECEFCKLIYDFSKTCAHYSKDAQHLQEKDLAEMMQDQTEEKLKMLTRIT